MPLSWCINTAEKMSQAVSDSVSPFCRPAHVTVLHIYCNSLHSEEWGGHEWRTSDAIRGPFNNDCDDSLHSFNQLNTWIQLIKWIMVPFYSVSQPSCEQACTIQGLWPASVELIELFYIINYTCVHPLMTCQNSYFPSIYFGYSFFFFDSFFTIVQTCCLKRCWEIF